MNVTVYSKNKCSMCTRTKRFLKAKGVDFVEKNTDKDDSFLEEAKATGFKSMPIVKVGEEIFSGHQQTKLEELFGSL